MKFSLKEKNKILSNVPLGVIDRISNFQEIARISHTHKNCDLLELQNFIGKLLVHYKIHGSGMGGIVFFNFASCDPLRSL